MKKESRSKYWSVMCDILDGLYPKGECEGRGKAIVLVSYIDMMINGWDFNENGEPIKNEKD